MLNWILRLLVSILIKQNGVLANLKVWLYSCDGNIFENSWLLVVI
jgi:hypothetical protein